MTQPHIPPDPSLEPQAVREPEPTPERLPTVHIEPGPEAADQIEPAMPDPALPQDAPRPDTQADSTPDPPIEPQAVREPEPEHPPAVYPEPGPEAAAPDPEPPTGALLPDAEPVDAVDLQGEPDSASDSEAVPDDVLDALFGSAGDGDEAGDTPAGNDDGHQAGQRPPAVEAAVIVDGETRHACVVVERTENGAVLRLGHPERDLPEILTLQILDGPELRCAQSWREDDKIGIEFF